MRPPESFPTDDGVGVLLEAYLDGDLPAPERAVLERRLAADEALRAELRLARRVRDGLRTLPRPSCPPAVTQAVWEQTHRLAWQERRQRVGAWFSRWGRDVWRPVLAMAVLLLLVLSAALVGRPTHTPPPAEVEMALDEVKWTLGYLSKVGREAGVSVRNEVLEAHVVRPVQEALNTLLDEQTESESER